MNNLRTEGHSSNPTTADIFMHVGSMDSHSPFMHANPLVVKKSPTGTVADVHP